MGLKLLLIPGLASTLTLAVALLLPCAAKGSPPPITVAVLLSIPVAAASTDTVIRIGVLTPAASGPGLSQVTPCPAMLHIQPVPLAAVGVRPIGTLSDTRMACDVAPAPELVRFSVKLAPADWP
jgi:hypothetical protein